MLARVSKRKCIFSTKRSTWGRRGSSSELFSLCALIEVSWDASPAGALRPVCPPGCGLVLAGAGVTGLISCSCSPLATDGTTAAQLLYSEPHAWPVRREETDRLTQRRRRRRGESCWKHG